jgi:hypothetical protein
MVRVANANAAGLDDLLGLMSFGFVVLKMGAPPASVDQPAAGL